MAKNTTDALQALRAKVKGQPTKKPTKAKTPKKTAVVVKTAPTPLKKDEIAYVIRDKLFGEFAVKASANAWWMESGKVEAAINAFKYRANKLQASVAAGISNDQLDYFIERHPEFSEIIERCKAVLSLKAKQTNAELLGRDGAQVRWFLETTEPAEYGKKPPLVAVQINMHERVSEDREAYT